MRIPDLPFLAFLTGLVAVVGSVYAGPIRPESEKGIPSLDVPRAIAPPVIDGRLDEKVWKEAATITGLLPARGEDTAARIARIPTTVRVLWDPGSLYVSFECVDDEVWSTGSARPRDQIYLEDVCEVFLDGVGDGRQYLEVQSSPAGRNFDVLYLFTRSPAYTPQMRMTEEFCRTDRWKFPGWEVKGVRTAGRKLIRGDKVIGWAVEMAIPAGPVMKRRGSEVFFPTEIRGNFVRYDWPLSPATGKRELLQMNWSPVLLGCPHISPSRMGRLNLVEFP
jgi:hypothetical protein